MPKTVDAPALRRRLRTAYERLGQLLTAVLYHQDLLRGSVYELSTRCGKPSCACNQGERHRRWVLSESREGRTRMRVVPLDRLALWKKWSASYRQFRSNRAEAVKLSQQILTDIDALERAQRRDPDQ